MKKIVFAFTCFIALNACNEPGQPMTAGTSETDSMATISARNARNSQAVYRAIETGDVSKLDSFIAEDFIDHEANMGRDIVGRDSLKHFLSTLHQSFNNFKIEMLTEATSPDGQYHFSLIRYIGTAKAGNPFGIPAGTQMDDTNIDLVKLKNGMASEHWNFTSQKDINEMMGAQGAPAKKQ